MLLGSLGLGLTAPVAVARSAHDAATWLALDAIPTATLEAALSAAAGTDSPEAYAEALAAALHTALGASAPPADVLLAALYGQLFRVLQEEVGDCAVVTAAGTGGALPSPLEEAVAPGVEPAGRVAGASPLTAEPHVLPPPRLLRPAVQPLGP